jgi:hypothetical protein
VSLSGMLWISFSPEELQYKQRLTKKNVYKNYENKSQIFPKVFLFYPVLLYRTLTVSRFILFFGSIHNRRTPWTSDRPVTRPLPKYRTTETLKNAHTHQTSMPEVGFEPTITASAQAKIVHALDCSATVTGSQSIFFKFHTYLFRVYLMTLSIAETKQHRIIFMFMQHKPT